MRVVVRGEFWPAVYQGRPHQQGQHHSKAAVGKKPKGIVTPMSQWEGVRELTCCFWGGTYHCPWGHYPNPGVLGLLLDYSKFLDKSGVTWGTRGYRKENKWPRLHKRHIQWETAKLKKKKYNLPHFLWRNCKIITIIKDHISPQGFWGRSKATTPMPKSTLMHTPSETLDMHLEGPVVSC